MSLNENDNLDVSISYKILSLKTMLFKIWSYFKRRWETNWFCETDGGTDGMDPRYIERICIHSNLDTSSLDKLGLSDAEWRDLAFGSNLS
jgi:hypothetical protein